MISELQTPYSELKFYFLFLRAINVGGHNTIRMKDLTLWMQQLGFTGIKTHLNSGNVIFQTDHNNTIELEKLIRQKIILETKLDIPCFIRSFENLSHINTILTKHEASKPQSSNIFITLLSGLPSPEAIQKLHSVNTALDAFTHYGTEIVLQCQQPYHQTKLSNALFEKTLKLQATTRNINTIQTLLTLAE
jgi:uncharacterized protein (DUF1697 family)